MLLPLLLTSLLGPTADPSPTGEVAVYVGTYTGGESQGIYRFLFDTATGKASTPELAVATPNPSFLAFHPSRKYLYAVNELGQYEGKPSGSVSAFAVEPSGKLKPINTRSSRGAAPCYLVVDRTGKTLLVANYSSGTVAALPVGNDGSLGEPASVIQHAGPVADAKRQGGPRAHSINIDATNRRAIAADLGLDKLLVYTLDPATARLAPSDPPSASVTPRSGPRHLAFHPDGRHAYLINEISLTVTAFDYNPATGALHEIQTVSTLPDGIAPTPADSTAEVQVHPSGKFLYGSNRGHDTLAVFAIDPSTGRLTARGHHSTQGKTPRNFAIDPTGAFLLAANQDSGSIVVFRIDPATGSLANTGITIAVPKPVCVKFLTAAVQAD